MEVQVTQENLSRALGNVGRVAGARANLEILHNILLRTENNQLTVAATNLEIASTQRVGAKIIKPGSFTVPAKLITELIATLGKGTIDLKVTNTTLLIKSGKNKATINGVSDEEFPELPIIEKIESEIELPLQLIKDTINQTILTASNDATRPVLTGVYWHTHDGYLYAAATDGYRLSQKRITEHAGELSAIIPTTTLQEVLRTHNDNDDTVQIVFDDTQVIFKLADGEITSRLIDGKFPDYRQLIPSSNETSFTTKTDDVKQIVKLASLFARDSGGSIALSVDTTTNQLTIRSIASEYGENTSDLDVQTSGTDGAVHLNSRYLNDALAVLGSPSFRFGFSGTLSPCVMTADIDEPEYMHIIMPIKS